MPNALNSDDKNLLLKAAESVGINPATFAAGNPWAEESQGALGSDTLKAAVYKLNPKRASEWMAEGGVQLSLAAEATLSGEREVTKEVWEELEIKTPHVIQERKESYEQQLLEKMTAEAEALEQKNRARKFPSGDGVAVSQHCNEWNRRMLGRMNQPARNFTGQ